MYYSRSVWIEHKLKQGVSKFRPVPHAHPAALSRFDILSLQIWDLSPFPFSIALLPVMHYLVPPVAELLGPLAFFGMILIHGGLIHLALRQGWVKSCWWAVGTWGLVGFGLLVAMLLLGRYGLGVW